MDVSKNIRVISTHALTEGDERDFRGRSERKHFNSRPHGGRLSITGDSITSTSFQLTPSRRATSAPPVSRPGNFYFNSRPHGGRLLSQIGYKAGFSFQLTPSRRATFQAVQSGLRRFYFNSRPHGGRPMMFEKRFRIFLISTHALTEGDFGVLVLFEVGNIFQLTPSRRATTSFMIYRKKRIHFNSRPHGGRHQNCSSNRLSIHFNSRPHGGRRSMQVLNTATQTFQLTPSRRATMAASIKKIRPGNFNSRPHGGRL